VRDVVNRAEREKRSPDEVDGTDESSV
ncbi:uncharacterized protein METZ01_LOCUS424229, partial [marine metagenome]